MSNERKHAGGEGSVLILTLWVLIFLAALALAVGGHVSSSIQAARKIKSRVGCYYLARGGAERAIFESKSNTNAWDSMDQSWSRGEDQFKDVAMGNGSYSVYYTYASSFAGITTNYGMYDEERKININKAPEVLLKSVMKNIGELDSMSAADLAAAIVDWRDTDDTMLTGGAENSYYAALSAPYPCHNGDFQSLHELLLVKGMTMDLFLKLKPYLTIYGTGKVNINTADGVVLLCVGESGGGGDLSACSSLADKVVRFRTSGNVFTEASVVGQLGKFTKLSTEERTVLLRMIGKLAIRSSCFGGIASGKIANDSEDDRRIEFVFDRQSGVKLYWHEF